MGVRPCRRLRLGPAGPRPRDRGRARPRRDRQVPRLSRAYARQHGRLPLDVRPEHPDQPLCAAARRRLHDPRHLLQRQGRLHQYGARRRLSRRRSPGGDLPRRAHGRCRGGRDGHRPGRASPPQHDPEGGLSLPDARPSRVRFGAIPPAASTGRRSSPTSPASPPEKPPRRRPAATVGSAIPPMSRPAASHPRASPAGWVRAVASTRARPCACIPRGR